MIETKILACPFCGSTEAKVQDDKFCVSCPACGATGPDFCTCDEAAANGWNKRAGGRAPDADKTAEAKHVGIGELLAGRLHWIRAAMQSGGMLSVVTAMPGKSIFRARMDWKGETPVVAEISTSIGGALENLDNYLMEDAADEMVKTGQV